MKWLEIHDLNHDLDKLRVDVDEMKHTHKLVHAIETSMCMDAPEHRRSSLSGDAG